MRDGSAPVGKPAARHREEVNQPPPMTTTVTLTPSSLPSILPHAMAVIQYFSATHIAFTARSLAKVQRIRKSYETGHDVVLAHGLEDARGADDRGEQV